MTSVVCCICGKATSISPLIIEDAQALLLEASSKSRSVYGGAQVSAITDKDARYFSYGIFQCQACEERFIGKREYNGPWVAVYPIPKEPVAEEVPEPIKGEFEEARLCFNVEAYRAAVAMCEIAMEATWRDQESSGLSELKEKGIISLNLYDRANEIRLWANVVKHELVPDAVTKDDAAQLITYLESVLYHIYVEPAKLDIVRRNRKELKNKQLD